MDPTSTLISVLGGAVGGVVAAVVGVSYQNRRERTRRHQDMVDAVREAFDDRMDAVVNEQRRVNEQLHGRISKARDGMDRVAAIEGELRAIRNLLDAIQQRYISRHGE